VRFGGAALPRLCLLVAILATLTLLGCWDNKRTMEQVLAGGYETAAQVVGAQYQRKLPFALDGYRPRFVEQDISVDLTWKGRDGKNREFRKVPVSESFARNIVAGDQVKLVALPAKVTDGETDVPVILPDAQKRLASLQIWIETSGYVALATWAAYAGLTLFGAGRTRPRPGQVGGQTGQAPIDVPPRRTMLGLGLVLIGGFMAFHAWSEQQSFEAMKSAGTEVMADILSVSDMPRKSGDKPSYAVRLAWKDGRGSVHHYGPTAISERFYGEITKNGQLAVKQTAIRFREDDLQARPLIVADAPEQSWRAQFGVSGGLVFLLVGLGCLFSAARYVGRQRAR
jgi:hypothetical protein